ncbi:MAG: hypothetical protein LKM39_01010 [Chiayiivirga sp.]|jgi:hypothetical protein|nr:hypothetical protein [Chiayiivirga sp.]
MRATTTPAPARFAQCGDFLDFQADGGQRRASSSREALVGTWLRNQFSENFIVRNP